MRFAAQWFVFLTVWTGVLVLGTSPVWATVLAWFYQGAGVGLTLLGCYLFFGLFFGALWVSE